ncbi:MAG: IclR family transcriptional regulator [Burkholderiales bacterium]|nr:IclR family transcriptional regulator [Burkholderiales bacterium]
MVKPSSDIHRAASRVLDILERLAASGETTTLAVLSAEMDIPKSSLLPLLRTLVARKWVEQPRPASYRLAPHRLPSGSRPAARPELPAVARPFLARLTAETGESSFLGVLPPLDDAVVYIDKVESPRRIRYSAELGERRPLHCTAVGMAVFAFLPAPLRTRLLRRVKLAPFTAHTSTDRALLARRLSQVARAGVAVTIEEFVEGAGAIAAPVYDDAGMVTAACALAGPTERMRASRDRYIEAVKASALAISGALGWAPDGEGLMHAPADRARRERP